MSATELEAKFNKAKEFINNTPPGFPKPKLDNN